MRSDLDDEEPTQTKEKHIEAAGLDDTIRRSGQFSPGCSRRGSNEHLFTAVRMRSSTFLGAFVRHCALVVEFV